MLSSSGGELVELRLGFLLPAFSFLGVLVCKPQFQLQILIFGTAG